MGKSCTDFTLPSPILKWETHHQNPLIRDEPDYTSEDEALFRDEKIQSMNEDQRGCYGRIIIAVETDRTHAHFFLSNPAGTGKTFLYQALCHHFRSKRHIVLCVASSGIAALLLPGGRTSHSRFKTPLECTPNGTSNITRQSLLAALSTRTSLIIWDEVPMQNKKNFAAVNTTLQDIYDTEKLFGSIPVLGGDFAQNLPIISQGNRGAQVNTSIRQSFLWPQFSVLKLSGYVWIRPISFLSNGYQIYLITLAFIAAMNYLHKLSIVFTVLKNSANLSFLKQIYIVHCIIQTFSGAELY